VALSIRNHSGMVSDVPVGVPSVPLI